jgi:hypothetical protein
LRSIIQLNAEKIKKIRLTGSKKILAFDLKVKKIKYVSSQFSHKQLVLVAAPVSTGAYFFIPLDFFSQNVSLKQWKKNRQ